MSGTVFVISCIIALIMLIWFKSDAFIEYARLFKLCKFLRLDDYNGEKFNNPYMTYPLFLKTCCGRNKYQKFFFKLIGCRLCNNVWMSMIGAFFIASSFISFIGYTSVLAIISLFIYGHIAKLLDENK